MSHASATRRAATERSRSGKNIPCDWPYAVRRYNGSGLNSYHYQAKILLNVLAADSLCVRERVVMIRRFGRRGQQCGADTSRYVVKPVSSRGASGRPSVAA